MNFVKRIKKPILTLTLVCTLNFSVTAIVPCLSTTTVEAATYSEDTIKEIQQKLNSLGYHCGVVDGITGANTKNAIKSYKKNNGLKANCNISKKFLKSLGVECNSNTTHNSNYYCNNYNHNSNYYSHHNQHH